MKAYECLNQVGKRGDRLVVERGMHDQAWVVRASAYDNVADIPISGLASRLVRAAREDRNPFARRYAAFAWLRIRGEATVVFLEGLLLTERDRDARAAYVAVLVMLGREGHAAERDLLLQDATERTRAIVRNALEEFGGEAL